MREMKKNETEFVAGGGCIPLPPKRDPFEKRDPYYIPRLPDPLKEPMWM